jgi:soluble calcium-activated nucleotidase 1
LEDVELAGTGTSASSSLPSNQQLQQRDARSISPTPTTASGANNQYRYTSSKAFAVEDSPDSSKKKTIKFSPLSLVMLPLTSALKKPASPTAAATSASTSRSSSAASSSSSASTSAASAGGNNNGSSSLSVAYASAGGAAGAPPPSRSESMAYPISTTSSMLSKIQYLARKHSSRILAVAACLLVVLFVLEEEVLSSSGSSSSGSHYLRNSSGGSRTFLWGGAVRPGYFTAADALRSNGSEFLFAAVADLDELSRLDPKKQEKPEFYSWLLPGSLRKLSSTGTTGGNRLYEIDLKYDARRKIVTKHNEAGRGAEFSELTLFENRLVTFDDRTGKVFEVLNSADGAESFVVPRFVVSEGDGDTDKGMKWEWSTVKDGELYMGSMGKEYTLPDGTVKNRNNLWIAVINSLGQIRRVDWTQQYSFVRHALKCDFPGYLIIEACRWSSEMKKWVFLPRRISREAYDEVKDEQKGGRELVLVDEGFSFSTVVKLNLDSQDPLKGFSTFAFVPNSGDRHALAIRSVEDNCVNFTPQCEQRSYFVVIDVTTGEQLSDEVKYPGTVKYEGVEFVNLAAKPPA